jgi:hypothetical protein
MTTETQSPTGIPIVQPAPEEPVTSASRDSAPGTTPGEAASTPDGEDRSSTGNACRRKGNVARLPKIVRNKINDMIQDGVPYPAIIKSLGTDGEGLIPSNLTHWKNGGYQDWVVEQAFLERTRIRQDSASDLGHDYDATECNHAALQLGSLHIFEALRDLGPGTLDQKLGGDSAAFARLINCLARISKETTLLQKYRDACAHARNVLKNMRDPNRKFTEAENRALVRRVDEILGLVSPDEPEHHDPDLRKPAGHEQSPGI